MAKNRGKVIKRRPEGLLCNTLKETYLNEDMLRPAQIDIDPNDNNPFYPLQFSLFHSHPLSDIFKAFQPLFFN